MDHNYTGHNYIGHNYMGHNYIGHNYIGHNDIGHNYTGHNLAPRSAADPVWADNRELTVDAIGQRRLPHLATITISSITTGHD